MDEKALLSRLAAQREHWADLPDGKRLKFHRPQEVDMPQLMGGVGLEHVIAFACGWEGFTESDLLGAAVGADEPVAFTPALWREVVRDRARYVGPVADEMAKVITEYLQAKDTTAKN